MELAWSRLGQMWLSACKALQRPLVTSPPGLRDEWSLCPLSQVPTAVGKVGTPHSQCNCWPEQTWVHLNHATPPRWGLAHILEGTKGLQQCRLPTHLETPTKECNTHVSQRVNAKPHSAMKVRADMRQLRWNSWGPPASLVYLIRGVKLEHELQDSKNHRWKRGTVDYWV